MKWNIEDFNKYNMAVILKWHIIWLEKFKQETLLNPTVAVFKDELSRLRQFLVTESTLKMMKNAFHFPFRSQDISIFVFTFWSCIKMAWLKK